MSILRSRLLTPSSFALQPPPTQNSAPNRVGSHSVDFITQPTRWPLLPTQTNTRAKVRPNVVFTSQTHPLNPSLLQKPPRTESATDTSLSDAESTDDSLVARVRLYLLYTDLIFTLFRLQHIQDRVSSPSSHATPSLTSATEHVTIPRTRTISRRPLHGRTSI